MREYNILGIDTSNYTTSLSVTNQQGEVLSDRRKLLEVKQGERGLRQSDAVFQHLRNFPSLLDLVKSDLGNEGWANISAVSVSSRPRPILGSYMPCFLAGKHFGEVISSTLAVPLYQFSHQEGHIEAIKFFSEFKNCQDNLLAWHLSGGTCELLKVSQNSSDCDQAYRIDIIGGSKDISFGQLLDRIGVTLGYSFPAGAYLDKLAMNEGISAFNLKGCRVMELSKINLKGLWFNLSGIETQAERKIKEESMCNSYFSQEEYIGALVKNIFENISDCLVNVTSKAIQETNITKVIFAGGVSVSRYIQKKLYEKIGRYISFGYSKYASDNSVGISLLGGKRYGNEAD